jgi:hypothetical protein
MSDNNTSGALGQWIASLRVGDTLTVDDIHRFVRVEMALRNADKHHQQARAMTAERDEWRDAAKWAENQHQHWKTVAEAATAQRDAAVRDVKVVREIRARRNVVVEASPELLTNGAFTDKPLHVMLNDNGDGTHLLTFRASDTIRELRQQLDASRLFSDEAVRERDAIKANYDESVRECANVMAMRENVSSQLWDCMNERDGYRARLAACERERDAYMANYKNAVRFMESVRGGTPRDQ